MLSFLVSLLLPSLFIALTTFQQEMIPTTLLITLMAQREGTPFGILIGLIPLLVHLVSLKSFGVDYFVPYSPTFKSNMKDLVIRVPWWAMKTRPSEKSGSNKTRQATHQYPASSDEIKNNDKSDTQK